MPARARFHSLLIAALLALGCSDSPSGPSAKPASALAWSVTIPGPSPSSRTVVAANNAVYVQMGRTVLALGADSGHRLWVSDSSAAPGERAEGLVTAPSTILARYELSIQALDAATGAVAWTRPVANGVSGFASDGARAFIASGSHLTAVVLGTGAVAWSLDSTTVCDTSPCGIAGVVTSGDTVLVLRGASAIGVAPSVRAFNAATGATLWTVAAVPVVPVVPSLYPGNTRLNLAGRMLILSDLYSGIIMGVDRATLRVVWSRVHGTSDMYPYFPVATRGDTVFASGRSGGTVAILASSGATLWQQPALDVVDALTPCGGRLIARTSISLRVQVWILASGDGRIIGGYQLVDLWPVADPAADGGRAFIATNKLLSGLGAATLVALDCSKL